MNRKCSNCGDEIINNEKYHDARITCSTECSIYLDDKDKYRDWAKWQVENNEGFTPRFNT